METQFLSTIFKTDELVVYVMSPGDEIYLTYSNFPKVSVIVRFSDKTSYYGVELKYIDKHRFTDCDATIGYIKPSEN